MVEIDTDRSSEALPLLDAGTAGDIGMMEFASSMEACRTESTKTMTKPLVQEFTLRI
jgi:hypothetical protein